tara:strand:+ start:522 stop:782 length:261 start_codon:yes stop_codon:yes gene_type:complete
MDKLHLLTQERDMKVSIKLGGLTRPNRIVIDIPNTISKSASLTGVNGAVEIEIDASDLNMFRRQIFDAVKELSKLDVEIVEKPTDD